MKNFLAFMALALFVPDGCGCVQPTPEPKVQEESWHDRYVQDHCENCPECCVTIEEDMEESGCGEGEDIVEDTE
jgi:hypothetical protein